MGIEMYLLVVMLIRKVSKQYKVKPSLFIAVIPKSSLDQQITKKSFGKQRLFFSWPQLWAWTPLYRAVTQGGRDILP